MEVAMSALEDVYSNSYEQGADAAMDAVRSLHPFWDEVGSATDLGRRVRWVRQTNDWVYGEPTLAFLAGLLDECRPGPQRVFVDLGCGMGKVAACASLRFGRVVGLELQEELLRPAAQLHGAFVARVAELSGAPPVAPVSLVHADFLGEMTRPWQDEEGRHWWEIADVAYACSPKFSDDTMRGLVALAARMRAGALLVTVRHQVREDGLQEVWRGEGSFSWGEDPVYLYLRT